MTTNISSRILLAAVVVVALCDVVSSNAFEIFKIQRVLISNGMPNTTRGTLNSQSSQNYSDPEKHDHQIKPNKQSNNFVSEISPNLSSCHDSYGRPDLLVNCCPPPDGEAQAIPIKFRPLNLANEPIKVRRPVHKAGPEYWAKYARAIEIMKSLPNSDPRSFSRQARIHCTYCTGAFNIKNSSRGLNVHEQWLFFPFHRMYLYFHERILGSLINDPSFALPFWSWDHPDSMQFPDVFLFKPFFDTERDQSHLAPRIVDLAYNPEDAHEKPHVDPAQNLALMYNQMVSAAPLPELFCGCSMKSTKDGFCKGIGTLESAPHNTVHSWVGSAVNPGRENMGTFYSAAWDPSFYPHHANVDRLFDVWRDIHNVPVPFDDLAWLNSYFYFYDENSDLIQVKVSDVLNTSTLGYTYEDIELLWMDPRHRPKPSLSPKLAKRALINRMSSSQTQNLGSQTQNLSSPIRVRIYRPKREKLTREEEVLVIHGIDVETGVDEMVKFDVYLNLADETKLGPSYREFVGTYTQLPKIGPNKALATHKSEVMKLGVTEAIIDLEANKDESVWVTLFPTTPSCARVMIGGIRIEYMR